MLTFETVKQATRRNNKGHTRLQIWFRAPKIWDDFLNPAKGVIRPSVGSCINASWLNKSQAKLLLSQPDRNTRKGKRDYAILLTLLLTGLRRSELRRRTMKEVLLIEASIAPLASRAMTLRTEGYHVTGVSTAADATRIIQRGSYDLIIADADVSGVLDVLASSATASLIMVDEDRFAQVARELPMGIWAFLIKPFNAARFRQAVGAAIEQSRSVKDAMQQRVLLPLNNSSKTLVSEVEMDQFFKHILEMTAAETESDGAAVLVLDEKTGQLNVKAGLNMPHENSDAYIRLSDWVTKTARSLVINDIREADPNIRQIMSDLGAASLMSVPLVAREKSIGAISAIMTGAGTRFTPANLEFLSILAKQAAAATENANLFKSVEKQRQDLKKMLERVVQSQENERKRMAVEIHDGIGQQLVGTLYRIRAFNTLLTQHKFEEAGNEAEDIRTLLEKTVGELRRVLAGLRPHSLDDLGLVSALKQEAEHFTRETKTECRFTIEGSPVDFTPGQEAAIYRIVQEALTNIRKHALATEAGIELRYQPESVSVTINDNGKGFKPERANNSVALGHIGLAGMKERAEMLGAGLSINSSPGRGTAVVLTIPLQRKNDFNAGVQTDSELRVYREG